MTGTHSNALPIGYRLHEYRIEQILGAGGFGITYLAVDEYLVQKVAIKEFFPNDLAVREGTTVHPKSSEYNKTFRWGLDRFSQEARTLAKFQHPNIVQVQRFFATNNTAYMVMTYEEGDALKDLLKQKMPIDEETLKSIVIPLLDGLKEVHAENFLHRDIKPGNIYIRKKNKTPVLLDFGAARQAMGSEDKGLTAMWSGGYTPAEQYETRGNQGAWTDIYAMAAVMYRVISGKKPIKATTRMSAKARGEPDPLRPAMKVGQGRYSESLLKTVDRGLAVIETDRPQSVAEWEEMFGQRERVWHLTKNTLRTTSLPSTTPKGIRLKWLAAGLLLAVGSGTGWYYYAETKSDQYVKSEGVGEEEKRQARAKERIEAKRQAQARAKERIEAELQAQARAKEKAETKLQAQARAKEKAEAKLQAQARAKEKAELQARAKQRKEAERQARAEEKRRTQSKYMGEFVRAPGGTFEMGCGSQSDCQDNEKPVHTVRVDSFEIGKYEVTQGQWETVMRSNPSRFSACGDDCPVEKVSWGDVQKFITKLNTKGQEKYRLPTEAEWEYACRSGGKREKYSGGNNVDSLAWHKNNSGNKTHRVGQKSPNGLEIYDMSGNVWEWVQDRYARDAYGKHEHDNPVYEGSGFLRVFRGGSWGTGSGVTRCTYRSSSAPGGSRFNNLGFRLIAISPN